MFFGSKQPNLQTDGSNDSPGALAVSVVYVRSKCRSWRFLRAAGSGMWLSCRRAWRQRRGMVERGTDAMSKGSEGTEENRDPQWLQWRGLPILQRGFGVFSVVTRG